MNKFESRLWHSAYSLARYKETSKTNTEHNIYGVPNIDKHTEKPMVMKVAHWVENTLVFQIGEKTWIK